MAASNVISGYRLCFDEFKTVEPKFYKILTLQKKAGLEDALGTSTWIYPKLIKEFYRNGIYKNEVLTTRVKDVEIKLKAENINLALGFKSKGFWFLDGINFHAGLKKMHHKKSPTVKGYKKKEFPQRYEFLADIIGKCICCKSTGHDFVNEVQLKLMTAISCGIQLNYGALLLEWIGKWILNSKKTKGSQKMLYG